MILFIVTEANGAKILGEAVPQLSVVLVCAPRNCSFTGNFCSNEISHKLILAEVLFENAEEAVMGKICVEFGFICCPFN